MPKAENRRRQSYHYSSNITQPQVVDNDETQSIVVPVPGMSGDDVQVNVDDQTLSVQGTTDTDRGMSFAMTIDPDAYHLDQAEAHLRNGLLQISIPKRIEDVTDDAHRTIPINEA
jgi:HSP20 family molecular chaperone IbpA